MYTPGMSVMSLLLKNIYENKRIENSFMEKENTFDFFSFPKKNFCPFGWCELKEISWRKT